jgi:predicted transcriptional regulator
MADFTREDKIKAAIKAIREKQVLSIREASRTFDIPKSTLQERLKGAQPHSIAHISSQRLTVPEEATIEKTELQMEI